MAPSALPTDLDLTGHRLQARGELAWIEPEAPLGGIARVVVTTRKGGASRPPYESLNLAAHGDDVPQRVEMSRDRVADALGWGREPVVAEQVHGVEAAPVGVLHAGTRWRTREPALAGIDALCTDARHLPLTVLTADCAPVVLVDAVNRVLGVAHVGWRGLAAGVLENLARQMAERYGQPEQLQAWIGPCIRDCCYEVGPEVAERFPDDARLEGERHRLDMYAAVSSRLRGMGIAQIDGLPLCTACHREWFFSHRRATQEGQPSTGRQALFAWLEPGPAVSR